MQNLSHTVMAFAATSGGTCRAGDVSSRTRSFGNRNSDRSIVDAVPNANEHFAVKRVNTT